MTRIIPVIRGFFFSPISDISFPYRVNQTFALACEILANLSFPPVVARINYIERTRNGSCSSPALHGKYWIFLARRSRAMIMTNKLLPVALIAALIGGSVGALVMHKSQPAAAETTTAAQTAPTAQPASYNEPVPAEFNTAGEQTAYKTGFADGYSAATQTDRR